MKKMFYYIKMKNTTPLHIGNGNSTFTDLDVIKDKEGKFFIPGTSLTGCFYHFLDDEDKKIFNPVDHKKMPKQSSFFISDAVVEEKEIAYETRDGIALDENKITKDKNKYDYEIVPAGYHFHFRIEVLNRDEKNDYDLIVNNCLAAINNQDIRLGYKTTRGLGNFQIEKVGLKVFDSTNYQNYFEFDPYQEENYDEYKYTPLISRYLNIQVYLKQKGGLSIRTYQTKKGEADFVHIHSAKKPVIPGTSWNGLFRKQFKYYLDLYKAHNEKCCLNMSEVFGATIEQKEKIKSNIYFEESIIENNEDITMVRNRINRFDNSTMLRNLYKETVCYNGSTILNISLNIGNINDYNKIKLIEEILLLIIKDLHCGFIALGGETAIGRGLFEVEKVIFGNKCIYMEEDIC